MDKLTLTSLPDNINLLFSHFHWLLNLIQIKIQGPTMAAEALDASAPSSTALILFATILPFITSLCSHGSSFSSSYMALRGDSPSQFFVATRLKTGVF